MNGPEDLQKMLLERLAQLRAEREQLIANVNAYNGAVQETERWLAQLGQQVQETAGASV